VQAGHLGEEVQELLCEAVGEILLLLVRAEVDEGEDGDGRRRRRSSGRGSRLHGSSPEKVPGHARSRRQDADADEERRQPCAAQARWRLRPLDPAGVHVEDPGERDDDGEADRERSDDVGQHRVGPVEPVHDRLDDLQHRERADAVADESPEDAATLQLRDQRHGIPQAASCKT